MLNLTTFTLWFTVAGMVGSETACNTAGEGPADQLPIVLPIRNITLQNVTRRATALSLGTPQQDIGFEVAPPVARPPRESDLH
jgi:hypothetical protein